MRPIPANVNREFKDLAFRHMSRPFGVTVQPPIRLLPNEAKQMKVVLDNCQFFPQFPPNVTPLDKTALMVNGSFRVRMTSLNPKAKTALKNLHNLMNPKESIFKEDFAVSYQTSKLSLTDVFCRIGLRGQEANIEPGLMSANEKSILNWNPNYQNVYLSLNHRCSSSLYSWLYAIDEKGMKHLLTNDCYLFQPTNEYQFEIPTQLLPSDQKVRLLLILSPSDSKEEVDRIMQRQLLEKGRSLPRAQDRVLQLWFTLNST